MKSIFLGIFIILAYSTSAQAVTELDKSPMDMSYCPFDYPKAKFQGKAKAPAFARIIYGRPAKAGRAIFGTLIEYNKVWRMGANESTEIEFFKPVTFGGKKLAKGRYTLFCIPTPSSWTIIINKDLDTWGDFSYNSKLDIARFVVPVQKTNVVSEILTLYFDASYNLNFLWDDVKVVMPVVF